MPDFGLTFTPLSTEELFNKTISPLNNTMPYFGPTAFNILRKTGTGTIYLINNKTGVATSYANIDLAMAPVFANTDDPSVTIESGYYDLPGGFAGWSPPSKTKIICHGNVYVNVPSGYSGNMYNYSPTGPAVIFWNHIQGGLYDEQSPQSNNWNFIDAGPTNGGALYESTFRDIQVWRCNKPIHLHGTDTGWINQNHFENVYGTACKYVGAYFDHHGTYTLNQSGASGNVFINVGGQATVADGTNHYPLVQGGFKVNYGQFNTFVGCNPWDVYQNASAYTLDIGTSAKGTVVIGGMIASILNDGGLYTQIIDQFSGVKAWKGTFTGRPSAENAGWDPALDVQMYPDSNGFETFARVTRFGSTDALTIENGSNASGVYGTIFRAVALSDNFPDWLEPLLLQSYIKNSLDVVNDFPLVILSARLQTTGGSGFHIVNRPLFGIRNYNTDILLMFKDRLDLRTNQLVKYREHYALKNTTPVTLADNERLIKVDASGGARTVNLPAAATIKEGKMYTILKSDSSANAVTIDGNSSETINGALTLVLSQQYQSVTIWCDGANWFTNFAATEKVGKSQANGGGTSFTIAHGLGATPTYAFVNLYSHGIAISYTLDSTNINVTTASATPGGTNNVLFMWRVIA